MGLTLDTFIPMQVHGMTGPLPFLVPTESSSANAPDLGNTKLAISRALSALIHTLEVGRQGGQVALRNTMLSIIQSILDRILERCYVVHQLRSAV